jgi:hypothetical protein
MSNDTTTAPGAASPLLTTSPLPADGGAIIGRNPKQLTAAEFAAAGVPLRPVMAAIRAHCLDCCAGQVGEVRRCVAVRCALWPLRMGVFPRRLRMAANRPALGKSSQI